MQAFRKSGSYALLVVIAFVSPFSIAADLPAPVVPAEGRLDEAETAFAESEDALERQNLDLWKVSAQKFRAAIRRSVIHDNDLVGRILGQRGGDGW